MFRNNRIKSIDLVESFNGTPTRGRILYEDGSELYYPIDPEEGLIMTEDYYKFAVDKNMTRLRDRSDEEFIAYTYDSINKGKNDVARPIHIVLPLNKEDLHGTCYSDYEKIMNDNPHINIWVLPQDGSHKETSYMGWLWIELPKEVEGVKYVPVIVHTNGISVHPYFHKYFLRSFDKKVRHLILGFIYVNGDLIISISRDAYKNKKDISEDKIHYLNIKAYMYKDTDAPKRINMGPDPRYCSKEEIENFENWLKKTRSMLES